MSELRKHLHEKRAKHREAQYPGDLASEIFARRVIDYRPREVLRSRVWNIAGALLAAAAMIAVAIPVWHRLTTRPYVNLRYGRLPAQEEQMPFVLDTTVSMPDDVTTVPSDLGSLIPDYQSMSIDNISSVPNVSDFSSDDESSQTSNSKEST